MTNNNHGERFCCKQRAYSARQAVATYSWKAGWLDIDWLMSRLTAREIVIIPYDACQACGYHDPATFADRCPNYDSMVTSKLRIYFLENLSVYGTVAECHFYCNS